MGKTKWHYFAPDGYKENWIEHVDNFLIENGVKFKRHTNWVEVFGENQSIYIAKYSKKYRYKGSSKWYNYKKLSTPLATIGINTH